MALGYRLAHVGAQNWRIYRKVDNMSEKLGETSMFALFVATALFAPLPEAFGESQLQRAGAVRLADNMGGGGSMKMDDKMGMQPPQGQSSQTGGMGGGAAGQPSGQPAAQSSTPGQMGAGNMQSQGAMGQGNSMGQGCMGMMMDNMMRMRSTPGMTTGAGAVDLTDRIDGRIAFLRAEVRITDAQNQAWNSFADAIRSSRQHLLSARQLLVQSSGSSADRLERNERHLAERLEALRSARVAYGRLYATLDDVQKRAADEIVVPFMATF